MHAAADRFRSAGHEVLLVDQYDGQVFDDYDTADAFAQSLGYPELMRRAVAAVEGLPEGFVAAGFSNGGGMAQYVATQRQTSGVLMLSGALPLHMLGSERWPTGLPAQIHYAQHDPFRQQEWVDMVTTTIQEADASLEVFDYLGSGHLFTDASLPAEYQPEEAALLWQRVLAFEPIAGPPSP